MSEHISPKGLIYQLEWRHKRLISYFGDFLNPTGDLDNDSIVEEVRFATSEDKYYPFSIYVIGPEWQKVMPWIPLLLLDD